MTDSSPRGEVVSQVAGIAVINHRFDRLSFHLNSEVVKD